MTINTNEISDGYHTFGELYEHRAALFVALINRCTDIPSWISHQHHDGTMFNGYFIAGMKSANRPDQLPSATCLVGCLSGFGSCSTGASTGMGWSYTR
jgi:hypothetical protein